MRVKIIELLEENIREKLFDIGFGSDFLDMILKAYTTKEKNRCIGLYQALETSVHQGTQQQSEKQPMGWGEK